MRSLIDRLLANLCAALPKRYWQSFDLPMANMAPASSMVTMLAGFAIGIPGFYAYLARLQQAKAASILEISKMQVAGKLPETADVSAIPSALYATAPLAFAFFTPIGLLCTYLVLSGFVRVVAAYIDEAHGDPILTGADSLARKLLTSRQQQVVRVERAKLERADEPDRRYAGDWAGLTGVDFVIVSARRKPGWSKGTWVITDEGWFVLGDPFDRPMPNGLRTVYPLTAQTTLEAVRKSVQYELPALRSGPSTAITRADRETGKPPTES
ncbi:MAG TPA: hypothetical protein VM096_18135 [Vicinamibacterales bacterium]|nr:hypothetical protein [Vicinamibacterales bacterium]